VNILGVPYEVPQEILLERRSTNDDGQIFNEMKTANHTILIIRHIKALEGFFVYYFIFFWRLSYYFYHQEIISTNTLLAQFYGFKKAHLISEHFL
jgi:hypothetical protein